LIDPVGNTSGLSGSRYATVEPVVTPEVVPVQQESQAVEDLEQPGSISQTVVELEGEQTEAQEPTEDAVEEDSVAVPDDQEESLVDTPTQATEPAEKRPEYPKRDRIATGGLKKV